MLFVLTGDVQTGKTRWIESVVDDLKRKGIAPYGVIAPGVWVDWRDKGGASAHVDANGFEKTGIDNVLLPSGERLTFARRADLAALEGTLDPQSQSERASLGWHIDDCAIKRVNAHFAQLALDLAASDAAAGFVVIDELGRLELERGGGLTEALSLLERGPFPATTHALVVVRASLLPLIEGRFESWGEAIRVKPDEPSRQLIFGA